MKAKRYFTTLAFGLFVSTMVYAQLDVVNLHISDGLNDQVTKQNIEKNASQLLSLFNSTIISGKSRLKIDNELCSKTAKESINDMWGSSAMMCPVSSITEKCIELTGTGYQVRNIPITILAADEDKQEQELVINFTSSGLIDNVLIALEEHRYMDIISANISVTDLIRRQSIIEFVENFRTAYNRKDISFLRSVFSNDALIITGKVVKVKAKSDQMLQSLGTEKVQYQTSTKEQYLSNLKRCFIKNDYINILFDEIEVVRHPVRDNIYGVTLKQRWNSSTYNDVGYVFLMIDFSDELQPCIQVRTWQPEKYNGKKIDRNEIFSINSFSI